MARRLIDRLGDGLRPQLVALGFRKRTGQIYTIELMPDVMGWLGLNSATEHYPTGSVEVNPVVGVRHLPVERMVAELRGERFHAYVPATVNTSIGYVMPEERFRPWVYKADPDTDTRDLVAAIETYGLPFMKRSADMRELLRLLEARTGYTHQLMFRYPVALWLSGDYRRAKAELDKSLEALGARSDPAAVEFRNFAVVFSRRQALTG